MAGVGHNVANLMLCITDSPFCDKLRVLELCDTKQRLTQVNDAVNRYLKVLQPKYILLALGNACKIYSYLEETGEFKPITDIPNYR